MRSVFIVIFLLSGSLLNAQMISRQVIASGGLYASDGGYHLESTIGETSVTSYENSDYYITQGFQQPSMFYEPVTNSQDEGTIISVYPNPVEDDLVLELNIDEITEFTVEVFTFTGLSLYTKRLTKLSKGRNYFTVDFSGYSGGIYMVHVYNPDREISRLFKIEKF